MLATEEQGIARGHDVWTRRGHYIGAGWPTVRVDPRAWRRCWCIGRDVAARRGADVGGNPVAESLTGDFAQELLYYLAVCGITSSTRALAIGRLWPLWAEIAAGGS